MNETIPAISPSRLYQVLAWVLPLYAVLSLSSMAGMNLSFLAVAICSTLTFLIPTGLISARLNEVAEYRRYLLWAWLLFAACMLSLIVARFAPATYAGVAPDITIHGFLKIWYLAIPAILAQGVLRLCRTETDWTGLLDRLLSFWWWMLLFLGVIAVIQYNTGWPIMQVIPTNLEHYHAVLFFGHHLSTASIIPFPAFTALAVAFGLYNRTARIARFELMVGAVGFLILFLSYARTAWLSLPIGIALLLSRYLSRRQFVVSFGAFIAILVAFCFTPVMKDRISNQMGIQPRFLLWKANIDYFSKRPLTGIGWLKTQEMSEFYFKERDPQNYKSYFWGHAHSNFFEMLGGTGLIGLLAFLGWTWFTLSLAYRNSRLAYQLGEYRLGDLSWGLFVGLFLLQFNGLTNVTFWEGKVMHQQMLAVGLLLIFAAILKRKAHADSETVNVHQ